jgi:hypothetical protein
MDSYPEAEEYAMIITEVPASLVFMRSPYRAMVDISTGP